MGSIVETSKVIYHSISKIVEYVPFKCYKLQHHQVSIYIYTYLYLVLVVLLFLPCIIFCNENLCNEIRTYLCTYPILSYIDLQNFEFDKSCTHDSRIILNFCASNNNFSV